MTTLTYFSPFFPSEDSSGTKGTTIPIVTTGTIGDISQGLGGITNQIANSGLFDNIPPDQISGLTLTSSIAIDSSGNQITTLNASWNASAASDLRNYLLSVKENSGNYVEYVVSGSTPRYSIIVRALQTFTAKVRAVDIIGNLGPYSGEVSTVSARDTVPPAAPTNFTVTGSFGTIYLNWTSPADSDVDGVTVYESNNNVFSNSTVIATVNASPGTNGGYARSALATGDSRYYWIAAYDTSRNYSTLVGPIQGTTTTVSNADVAPDVGDGIKTVTTLPTSGVEGDFVFLSTDKSLYVYKNGAWTKKIIAATDLTGTLAGTQITPGSIDTSLLGDGIITAAKLGVGNGSNLLYGSDGFQPFDNFMILNPQNSIVAGYGRAYSPDYTLADGSTYWIQQNSQTGAPDGTIGYIDINYTYPISNATTSKRNLYDTTEGERLIASVYVDAHRCQVEIFIGWVNGDGNVFAFSESQNQGGIAGPHDANGAQLNGYQRISVYGTAPTGTRFAALYIRKYNHLASVTSDLSSFLFFTRPQLEKTAPNATQPSPWSVAGQTIINGGSIRTNSIQAISIVAGSITTDRFTANTIDGSIISANTLNANKIVAGTIQAAQIAAGAITASKIGIFGEGIFPDPYLSDIAFWTSSFSGPGYTGARGYLNPEPVNYGPYPGWFPWYGNDNQTFGGGPNAWRLCSTSYGATMTPYTGVASTQVVAPVVTGIVSGQYYNVKTIGTNYSNWTLNFLIQWFNSNGGYINGAGLKIWAAGEGPTGCDTQVKAPEGASQYRIYWQADSVGNAAFSGTMVIGGFVIRQAGTGSLLVDGTVSATKLIAKSITADQIQANSIGVDQLNSNSSLPASMTISGTGFSLGTVRDAAYYANSGANRIPNASFLAGTNGWYHNDNNAGPLAGFGKGNTAGKNYLKMEFNSAPNGSQFSIYSDPTNNSPYSGYFSVRGGETLSVSGRFEGQGINNQTLRIWWYKGDYSSASTGVSDYNFGPVGTFTQMGFFVTAPNDAQLARIELYGNVANSGTGYASLVLCEPMVASASPGQGLLPSFTPTPASDAAASVNANTTTISPGKIQLQGGTTLRNWMQGGDSTLIEGGAIAANTITANKLTIGNRGINFPAVYFQVIPGTNNTALRLSNGFAQYTDSNGGKQQVSITGGDFPGNSGTFYYVYWYEGDTGYRITSDSSVARAETAICLATWQCGTTMIVQNFGGTIIDGANITTGTLTADKINAHTITANEIQLLGVNNSVIALNTVTSFIAIANPNQYQGSGSGTTTSPGGGSGGGSGGGGFGCVDIESFMPYNLVAKNVIVGDPLEILSGDSIIKGEVTSIQFIDQPCYRIETNTGIKLIASNSTPITLQNGTVISIMHAGNESLPVIDGDRFYWDPVKRMDYLGIRTVALIAADDGTYAAGEESGRYILTHNKAALP